uniref:Putative secreted protein n=1 Tax=Anopheles triannulatus TaxID=58253 RepID=A0A2M4B6M0_9DIPT
MLLPLLLPLTAGLSAPCILMFVWVEEVAADADKWTGWSKSLATLIFEGPVLPEERSPELVSVGRPADPNNDWECNSGCCRESLCC